MSIQFPTTNSFSDTYARPAGGPPQDPLATVQRQLQQSPELRQRLAQLPHGEAFVEALDRLQDGNFAPNDVKAVQQFLEQVPGVKLTAPQEKQTIDGKYGPRTELGLQTLANHFLSQDGMNRLETATAPRYADASTARPRKGAQFNPVATAFDGTAAKAGATRNGAGREVMSQVPITPATFHPQYDSNISAARDADCGPASAAMVVEAAGLGDINSGTIRRRHMGVSHNGATTSQEVVRGIESASKGKLDANIIDGNRDYARNPQAFLNRMREELAAGKQVILLTKNLGHMADGRSAGDTNGHYMVIQGITADNQLILADPGSRGKGLNRTIDAQTFLDAYAARAAEGMPNNLITVQPRRTAG
jgi:hypothetical protein